jgi:hypothetical protein
MSQIVKKFIGNNEVGAEKIRLESNAFLRIRNNDNDADLEVLKSDADDETVLKSLNYFLNKMASWWWSGDVYGLVKNQGDAQTLFGLATADHVTDSTNAPAQIALTTGRKPGASSTGATGGITLNTGFNEGPGASGSFYLETGETTSGASGDFGAYTGGSTAGASGQLYLESGPVSGGSGNTGRILLKTGSASGSSGRSGSIELFVGSAGTAGQGNIICTANGIQIPNQVSEPTLNLQDGLMYYNPSLSNKHPYIYDITAAAWKKVILEGDPELSEGATWARESLTLSSGHITNGYVDLAEEIINASLIVTIYSTSSNGGLVSRHGVDYTLSVEGGVTRITFSGHTPALAEDDILVAQYQY